MQQGILLEIISNFVDILASPQSELALQTMKDPYIFDFIELRDDMVEREEVVNVTSGNGSSSGESELKLYCSLKSSSNSMYNCL